MASMPTRKPALAPSSLKYANGDLPVAALARVDDKNGKAFMLYVHFARLMIALHFIARVEAGIILTSTGRYRELSRQWAIFGGSEARYEPCSYTQYVTAKLLGRAKKWDPIPRRAVAQKLGVNIPDATYWRKKKINGSYPATAAVPGESNHGYGGADDVAEIFAGKLVGLRATTLQWLYINAPRVMIFWESKAEVWHVHDCSGGSLPAEVVRYEAIMAAPPLAIGSEGPHVQMLQAQMNAKGADLAVDGKFGQKTKNAVRFMQGVWGQPTTGAVGPEFRWMVGK